jgi:glyoxylase-like metal-dependent hydrolase (beta-lactamase superfamily II)
LPTNVAHEALGEQLLIHRLFQARASTLNVIACRDVDMGVVGEAAYMIEPTMGQLNEQASVRRLQIDDVTFTFIADGAMSMTPQMFLAAIPTAYWDAHPDELDRHNGVAMSAGGLLVERGNHRLLIDAGLGPLTELASHGQINCGAFMDVLERLGLHGTDIDVFALTHLHADHTGWAFVESAQGRREPTFPNAPYVVAALEWEALKRGERPLGVPGEAEFIEPIAEHSNLLRLISDGDEVAPGVTAIVTGGHSPGHTSYVVTTSRRNRLVAFGDCFHTPAQLHHPEWPSAADVDPSTVGSARRRILSELCAGGTVGFAIHFGDQPFGTLAVDGTGSVAWEPVPTTALLAPPRTV